MAFDITKYLENNKIELGSIKKEVGTNISKSGQNDLRRTTYDVKIKDGKFQLNTHKSIMTESKKINEETLLNRNVIGAGNTTSVGNYSDGSIVIQCDSNNLRLSSKKQVNNLINILNKLSKNI